ncbi:MAG: cohesin domain-containing protein, partial [Planctomycetota bacterium]|nr:cohesin domain-containing protein [Planctomycetota bacterium]
VVLADNQITCVTPSHIPELVDITVTNPDGTHATLLHGFTFVDQGVVVSLPTVSGDHGAIVEVPISVSNVNGLTAADISITFASGVLSAQSVRVGNLTAGWTLSANRATPGTVTISMASAMAVTGSGVLAYITFQVNGAPTTQTALTVASALLNDGTVTCALSPGNFTVNGLFSVAGSVTYFTGNGPVPGTDLSLVGVGVLSASSGSNGAFSFSGVPTGAYTLAPAKDDDVDQITAYDASLVLQAAAGMLTLSSNQRVAADVNGNGLVNSMDAYYILQKSVGLLDVPFPGAGTVWDFVPASRSYSLLNSNQTGQNFTAILVGDVSGNWVYVAGGSGQTMMGLTAEEEPPAASLSLPTIEATSTQRVVLPLQIDPASAEVYSADLVLTYDPAVLSLQGVNAGGAAADMGYAFNTSQPGTIRAGFAGAQPLAAGGTLMELVFDVVGTLQTPAVVSLATAELNEGQVDATAQDGLVRDTLAPCTTAVRMNGDSARGAGALDPSGAGIRRLHRSGELRRRRSCAEGDVQQRSGNNW